MDIVREPLRVADVAVQRRTPRAVAALGHGRISELDGVRALAILYVFANHFFANDLTMPAAGTLHGISSALLAFAAHGWLGVDLFFVLSGFLITGILLDTRGRATYFRDFWVRRALRILPLVFTVVTILALIYRPSWLLVLMAYFFAVDFAGLFGIGNNAMGPLWSLAVEEQFYLIWPALVLVLPARALGFLTLGVVAVEPMLRASLTGAIDLPWFRLDGLALGALVAVYVRSRYFSRTATLRGCAVALAVALVLFIFDIHHQGSTRALRITEANLVFGVLVAASVTFSGHTALALLRTRTARFIADTSFCAYLIHVPLLLFVRQVGAWSIVSNPFVAAALQAAVAIALTFVIATFSRIYLELPFQRLKNRLAPAPAT